MYHQFTSTNILPFLVQVDNGTAVQFLANQEFSTELNKKIRTITANKKNEVLAESSRAIFTPRPSFSDWGDFYVLGIQRCAVH